MLVVRLGQGFWRWVAIAVACGLIAAVLRWGSGAVGLDVQVNSPLAAPLTFVPTHDPALALTFAATAPSLSLDGVLRTLSTYGVPATFFVGTGLVRGAPATVRALAAAGNEVELQAPSGFGGSGPAAVAAAAALHTAALALPALAGTPHFVQPAPGGFGGRTLRDARSAGLTVVGWSVDPQDWAPEGADVVIGRVLGAATAGDIVALHCTTDTVQALPAIIEGLRAKGMDLTTLDGLLALAEGAATAAPSPAAAGPAGA